MFQRGETIIRIKSMMKGMLAVVMAMSMAACSGAPAADQTSSESPSPAQTESTAATEQETIVTEVSAETQTQEETAYGAVRGNNDFSVGRIQSAAKVLPNLNGR